MKKGAGKGGRDGRAGEVQGRIAGRRPMLFIASNEHEFGVQSMVEDMACARTGKDREPAGYFNV
jgi:hypothetical protein